MTAIFNLPKDLQGKVIVPRQATLDINIRFGLWADYTYWVDAEQHLEFWHNPSVLEESEVSLEITLGNKIVLKKVFTQFEDISLTHVFEDMEPGDCDLRVMITNLSRLPVRTDNGRFVSGMCEISSVKLQGIEIVQMFENTMFGLDADVSISMSKPIYPWMLANHQKVLPKVFNFPMIDIVTIN